MVLSTSPSSSPSRLTPATHVPKNANPPTLEAKPERLPPSAGQPQSQPGPDSLKRKSRNSSGYAPPRTVTGARNSASARTAQTRQSKAKPVARIASRYTGERGRPSANTPNSISCHDTTTAIEQNPIVPTREFDHPMVTSSAERSATILNEATGSGRQKVKPAPENGVVIKI